MAAILCRICIIKPYQACYKCCATLLDIEFWDRYCQVMGKYSETLLLEYAQFIIPKNYNNNNNNNKDQEEIEKKIDIKKDDYSSIRYSYKPLSICLFMSIIINFSALFGCIISMLLYLFYGNQICYIDHHFFGNVSLFPFNILLFICGVINGTFTYYMYHTINYSSNPLFNKIIARSDDKLFILKLWEFFKYDIWMAVYIIYLLFKIILLFISISLSINCNSIISNLVLCTSIILFLYLIVSILTLFSYISFELFKEMTNYPIFWYIPIFWPCIFIGYGLIIIENFQKLPCIQSHSIQSGNNNKEKNKCIMNKYKLFYPLM